MKRQSRFHDHLEQYLGLSGSIVRYSSSNGDPFFGRYRNHVYVPKYNLFAGLLRCCKETNGNILSMRAIKEHLLFDCFLRISLDQIRYIRNHIESDSGFCEFIKGVDEAQFNTMIRPFVERLIPRNAILLRPIKGTSGSINFNPQTGILTTKECNMSVAFIYGMIDI